MASRIKITENIYLDEIVPPEIYSAYGEKSLRYLDMRIILGWQYIRDVSGCAIHFNDWWNGGHIDERGFRIPTTRTGAKYSQHKFGRAIDGAVEGMSPAKVHDLILHPTHQKYLIERQMITCLEDYADTPTWTHADCRYTSVDRIIIVKP